MVLKIQIKLNRKYNLNKKKLKHGNFYILRYIVFIICSIASSNSFISVDFPILDKLYISYPEPYQQAVVWPSYPQPTMQAPHLLMPSMAQQMQPPPLTPMQLLSSDYLGSATLHQVK